MVVTLEAHGHIAVLTINRPEARNAVNGAVATGMEARLDEFEANAELWVGVVTGVGSTFSAGADLKEIAAGRGGDLGTARGGFAGLVTRKRSKPLIAAVNGPALAGGCEIALACDMIVAAENARFGLPEVKRSLLAAAGGLPRLPRAIGMANAMEIILTGDPMSAERAYELGLINRVTPEGKALEAAMELAARVAANAPLAVQASRNIAARAFTDDDATLWRDTFSEFQRILQTEDAKEGPMAFIEKRAPRWKAR
ncbi:MAG TPA: crotonase/enoyl-CoA hydratase family protein [Candidatus Binataceae bacterium]